MRADSMPLWQLLLGRRHDSNALHDRCVSYIRAFVWPCDWMVYKEAVSARGRRLVFRLDSLVAIAQLDTGAPRVPSVRTLPSAQSASTALRQARHRIALKRAPAPAPLPLAASVRQGLPRTRPLSALQATHVQTPPDRCYGAHVDAADACACEYARDGCLLLYT